MQPPPAGPGASLGGGIKPARHNLEATAQVHSIKGRSQIIMPVAHAEGPRDGTATSSQRPEPSSLQATTGGATAQPPSASLAASAAPSPTWPKVALLFLAPNAGLLNEGLWAAFLEHASLLRLRRAPPAAVMAHEAGDIDLTALVGGPLHPDMQPLTWRLPSTLEVPRPSTAELQAAASQARNRDCVYKPMQRDAKPSDSHELEQAFQRLEGLPCTERAAAAAAAAAAANTAGDAMGAAAARGHSGAGAAAADAAADNVGAAGAGARARSRCTHPLARGAWERLFSLHAYVGPPGRLATPDSLLCSHEVETSVDTTGGYAQHVLVEAALALIAAALADPLNVRFGLLSDLSVPLRPPGLLWAQLLAEDRSRVDPAGCKTVTDWVNNESQQRQYNWRPKTESPVVLPCTFGKTSQWITLTRQHAALAAADRHVAEVMRRYCYTGPWRIPGDRVSDATRTRAAHAVRAAQLAFLEQMWQEVGACPLAQQAREALLQGQDWDPMAVPNYWSYYRVATRCPFTGGSAVPANTSLLGSSVTADAQQHGNSTLGRTAAGPDAAAKSKDSAANAAAPAAVGSAELSGAGTGGAAGGGAGGSAEADASCKIFHGLLSQVPDMGRVCVSDEHYFSTLLASYGLASQGTCMSYGSHYLKLRDWHAKGFKNNHVKNMTHARAVFLRAGDHPACDHTGNNNTIAAGIAAALEKLFTRMPAEALNHKREGQGAQTQDEPASYGTQSHAHAQAHAHQMSSQTFRLEALGHGLQRAGSAEAATASLAHERAAVAAAAAAGEAHGGGQLAAAAAAAGAAGAASGDGAHDPDSLQQWLHQEAGFQPMPYHCPLFGRKFVHPVSAFQFVLSCDGLRVGWWCK